MKELNCDICNIAYACIFLIDNDEYLGYFSLHKGTFKMINKELSLKYKKMCDNCLQILLNDGKIYNS